MSQVDPGQNLQLLETLKNELHHCQTECNQTQLFLTKICHKLHSTQELISQYHVSAKIKSDRITQLEQELELKSKQLEAANFEHEELHKRLKTEKHNASQYKAALHRCLDTSQLNEDEAKQIYTQAHILASSNYENYIEITALPPLEHALADKPTYTSNSSATLQNPTSNSSATNLTTDLISVKQGINQAINHQLSNQHTNIQTKSHRSELPKIEVPIATPSTKEVTKEAIEERPKSLAAIKLPQFAPLKPR